MDQIEHNQVTLKEEMDVVRGKIDQLLETMLALARREDGLQHVTFVETTIPALGSTSHLWSIVTNPRNGIPPIHTPPQVEDPIQPHLVHITVSNEIHTVQGIILFK